MPGAFIPYDLKQKEVPITEDMPEVEDISVYVQDYLNSQHKNLPPPRSMLLEDTCNEARRMFADTITRRDQCCKKPYQLDFNMIWGARAFGLLHHWLLTARSIPLRLRRIQPIDVIVRLEAKKTIPKLTMTPNCCGGTIIQMAGIEGAIGVV